MNGIRGEQSNADQKDPGRRTTMNVSPVNAKWTNSGMPLLWRQRELFPILIWTVSSSPTLLIHKFHPIPAWELVRSIHPAADPQVETVAEFLLASSPLDCGFFPGYHAVGVTLTQRG